MMVRNSLMNAGNPIFNAFAMEQVAPVERASLSAAMSVLWQIGWVIGGTWYAVLQATLGFTGGYTVNFITIIALYTIATAPVLGLVPARPTGARAARTAGGEPVLGAGSRWRLGTERGSARNRAGGGGGACSASQRETARGRYRPPLPPVDCAPWQRRPSPLARRARSRRTPAGTSSA